MNESPLRRQVRWLIAIRVVVSTILLGSALAIRLTSPGSFVADPIFFLIALTYALTVVYAATLRYVDRHRWLVDVQLAGDALIVSGFIASTGGITSYFSTLYVLPVVAASTIQFRHGGLLVATFSAILYTGLVFAQYLTAAHVLAYSWLLNDAMVLPTPSVAQYTVALNLCGFFGVALLSGSLADRLQSAGVRLEQASTAIADLQALNQHVIESLPSGLVTTDRAQTILTFNRAAEAITGVAAATAIGRPVAEVLQFPSDIKAAFEGSPAMFGHRLEWRYRRPDDGGSVDIGLTATHVETPGGRAGLLFSFQDVTMFKKLARDAAIQQRLAAVGEMAAGIAHEIRNPLASMSGSIQILRQELPLTTDQAQLMDIVLRESERLNNTIRSFLAYARPQRFQIAAFDVRRALTDTALLLRNSSELKEGHTIDLSVPDQELVCEADEGQIKQIVWNLATNGLRAMPAGGRLRLSAATAPSGDGVVLMVEDEGVGIAPEEAERMFQPFHGGFEKGSGLGLAIVHRIVSDYNGEIQVRSQPGAGTAISVRLSHAPADRAAGRREPEVASA